jgi:hypothetical protein
VTAQASAARAGSRPPNTGCRSTTSIAPSTTRLTAGLAQRGIASEHYGFNEYQETIHLRPETAIELFGERGLARGPMGELVIDPLQTMAGHSYMADPDRAALGGAPEYDQAVSPLFGDAISQDNLGGAAWHRTELARELLRCRGARVRGLARAARWAAGGADPQLPARAVRRQARRARALWEAGPGGLSAGERAGAVAV